MMKFSLRSAFYMFNLVANWAYTRWDLIYPELLKEITTRETAYLSEIQQLDNAARALAVGGEIDKAIDMVTKYSVATGEKLVEDWEELFGRLFVKYRDGYVITEDASAPNCGCRSGNAAYPSSWYDRIVKDTGAHYYYGNYHPASLSSSSSSSSASSVSMEGKHAPADKLRLLSKR